MERENRKSDGHVAKEVGWTKVRRKKADNSHTKVISSFYISNIPVGTSRVTINDIFKSFGKIVDIYLTGRKDRGGMYFGFVRFIDVADVLTLERKMHGLRY